MRSLLSVMVVLGGCVADAEESRPRPAPQVDVTELASVAGDSGDMDVCALAAELSADDICSLICDPTAMAARLVADGNDRGSCYQLYCALPGDGHVLVGVCLPP